MTTSNSNVVLYAAVRSLFEIFFTSLSTLLYLEASFNHQGNVEHLGCFRDLPKRSIPSMEGMHHFLHDRYWTRSDAIKKCAHVANEFGYTVFGVQNNGQCFSGPHAEKMFDMYGPSNLCKCKYIVLVKCNNCIKEHRNFF